MKTEEQYYFVFECPISINLVLQWNVFFWIQIDGLEYIC